MGSESGLRKTQLKLLWGQGKARCNMGKEGSQVGRQGQEEPGG